MSSFVSLKIWDLPTRLFHIALVLLTIGAIVSAKIMNNLDVHMMMGYGVLGLVLFRWGWVFWGGYWSRIRHWPLGSVLAYLKGETKPEWQLGHNPLGSWSVVGMLVVWGLQAVSGLLVNDDIAHQGPWSAWASSQWVTWANAYHEIGQLLIYLLIVLHVSAIIMHTFFKKDHQMVKAMLHGHKSVVMATTASRDDRYTRLRAILWGLICISLVTGMVLWGRSFETIGY